MRMIASRRAQLAAALLFTLAALAMLAFSGGAGARPGGPDIGTPGVDYVDGRVLVKFAPGAEAPDIARAHAAAGGRVDHVIGGIDVQVVDVGKGRVLAALQAYSRNPNVQFVEVDGIVHATAHECTQAAPDSEADPNDTLYHCQWGLHNEGQRYMGSTSGTADADVDAPEAWATGALGTGITIAILDTGYDASHEDLAGKLVGPSETSTKDFTGDGIADLHGHGTWTASIAAASTGNGKGIAGTAPEARLLIVKVLDNSGAGSWSTVASGITWAADNGADVISMSLGGKCRGGPFFGCGTLESAVNDAWSKGALLVAAAGNGGSSGTEYPGAFANVIAVAASDANDERASFSDYGDVAAPGVDILGAFPSCGIDFALGKECGYDYGNGTSASTPIVAGVAALVWGQHPGLNNEGLRNTLETTAEDLPGDFDGHGRVNACAALAAAGTECSGGSGGEEPTATPTEEPTPTPTEEPTATPTPTPGGINLSVIGEKVRGTKSADLGWSGANGDNVHIVRDGSVVATTANDGTYTDNIGKGGGSHTYKVCEAGTSTCSNEATVTY